LVLGTSQPGFRAGVRSQKRFAPCQQISIYVLVEKAKEVPSGS